MASARQFARAIVPAALVGLAACTNPQGDGPTVERISLLETRCGEAETLRYTEQSWRHDTRGVTQYYLKDDGKCPDTVVVSGGTAMTSESTVPEKLLDFLLGAGAIAGGVAVGK